MATHVAAAMTSAAATVTWTRWDWTCRASAMSATATISLPAMNAPLEG